MLGPGMYAIGTVGGISASITARLLGLREPLVWIALGISLLNLAGLLAFAAVLLRPE